LSSPTLSNVMTVALTQALGIALLLYLVAFLPVMTLAYFPALAIHSWREREEPLLRISDPSDL